MPFGSALLGDFLGGPGGFNETSERIRSENLRTGEETRAREGKILEHLSTSDDPQIRAAAVTGMLTRNDKGTGLDKWFGKQSSHPAFPIISQLVGEGHQPFLSPEEKIGKETEARYGGEISGTIKAAENAGTPLSPDEIHRMVSTRFHNPARPFSTHPTSVKYTDENNEIKTAGVIYDPNDRMYYNSDGQTPFPYADSIVGESRSGHFTEPNAFRGAYQTTVPDEASPTKYSRVHWTAEGKEIGRAPTMYTPPPTFEGGSFRETPTGPEGIRRGSSTYTPIPEKGGGTPPPKAVTPQTSAEQLDAVMRRVDAGAKDEVTSLGILGRDPAKLQAAKDRHARTAGFKDYADLEAQHGAAVRGVGAGVQPPAPPKEEKGKKPAAKAGGIDVDKVLDFLKKRPQE